MTTSGIPSPPGNGGPLTGKRILEIGHMLAGPYCGMLLADLGAEVIKIETGDGDISRHVGPNYIGAHNVYFASLNRNKKSVKLDLTTAADRTAFNKLVASSDALICNLRPKAIKKLGLTYQALRTIKPTLVCVALTGYGLEGPYSEMPAYDYVIQALCGVTLLTGNPDAPPTRLGYSVADNTGGMMAAIGLLAKLVEGKGGQVDVALYDTLLSQLNYLASAWLNAQEAPERKHDGGHAYIVPAQFFATRDGYIALFITHDEFWRLFAEEVGKPEWIDDPQFATMKARSANREQVVQAVKEVLKTGTSAAWVGRLQPKGIVIAGIRTLQDALEDEQTRFREMVISIPTEAGEIKLMGNPIKTTGTETFYPPPLLGQHNPDLVGQSD